MALNTALAALRTDNGFDADLRNLITRYRRHNPHPDALTAWDELRDRISRCALPLPARA